MDFKERLRIFKLKFERRMSIWKEKLRRRNNRYSFSRQSYLKQPEKLTKTRLMLRLAKFAFIGVIILIVGSFLIFPLLAYNLPSPDKVVRQSGFSTKILDRNGKLLYEIYANQNRTPVSIKDIPDYLKEATISVEDKNFYKHQGFDPTGIFRAVYNTIVNHRLQGGSTLTQQLVKNVLLTPERTLPRKIKEFVMAIEIERKYSKDEILQMYLNEVPYGGTAWGVGAASQMYFGKDVKDLDLVESAILAGLPQAPSVYSPYSSTPTAYVERTKIVLKAMKDNGYISQEQEDEAVRQLSGFKFQNKDQSMKAPHFVQYVQKILDDTYGQATVEQGGLTVTTTLDLDLQNTAQQIVSDEISKVEKLHITNGASVVMNPETGEILAMVGSKNFFATDYDGQVNVTVSLRQPGSSFKPFTYVTAFKKGYTPSTLLMDTQTEFPGGAGQPPYIPVNYDGKFRGPIQVRYALANSVNVPAVKMLGKVGIKDVLQTATDLGITTLPPTQDTLSRVGLSLTLGGGEVRLLDMADAYSAFLNEGFRVDPVAVLKVTDSNGKVLEDNHPDKGNRVLTPEQAYLIDDILSDNDARTPEFGANSQLYVPGKQLAVKTGTTNDKRDNWTIGGDPQVVVGVWVGNNDNSAMLQVASGITGASPIWHRIVVAALNGKSVDSFQVPGGIVTAAVDTISGYAAHDGYPSRIEKFIDGTQPTGNDPVHTKLKVCKSDGNLATPSDVAGGNYDEKEFYVFKEEDPVDPVGSENKWQNGINAWLATQPDPKYHPPTSYCGTANPVNVDFINPKDQTSNLSNKFTVEVSADSTADITNVDLYTDGQKLISFTAPPYKQDVNLSSGVHTLRAVATDSNGKQSDRIITVGVNVPWNPSPTPTPSPVPSATPTPTPTP